MQRFRNCLALQLAPTLFFKVIASDISSSPLSSSSSPPSSSSSSSSSSSLASQCLLRKLAADVLAEAVLSEDACRSISVMRHSQGRTATHVVFQRLAECISALRTGHASADHDAANGSAGEVGGGGDYCDLLNPAIYHDLLNPAIYHARRTVVRQGGSWSMQVRHSDRWRWLNGRFVACCTLLITTNGTGPFTQLPLHLPAPPHLPSPPSPSTQQHNNTHPPPPRP
jgi:hypothetical protein